MARRLLLIGALLAAAPLLPAQETAAAAAAPEAAPGDPLRQGPHAPPAVRERLIELLQLPKDRLWDELMKWPSFQRMTFPEQAAFVQRLSEMRQRVHAKALRKAVELGLRLPADKEEPFVRAYLDERLAIERRLAQPDPPKRHELDEAMDANLKQAFAPYAHPRHKGAPPAPAVSVPTAPAPTTP